ncbi:MAG: hypothetical protein Q9160_004098 [Pyrenula sp. 1 TL-2023]
MYPSLVTLALLAVGATTAQETILGVYTFSRHGDRTAKSTPPTNLTNLGYSQVFASGSYFRQRYVDSGAASRIAGVNADVVKLSQLAVSAPLDNVLMNSAQGFLQGLYPPVGAQLGSDALRNGSIVQPPLNGYQLIPIQQVSTGTGSEDAAWLQGAQNCQNAMISSNNYFITKEYQGLLRSTQSFYGGLSPMVNATFPSQQISYKNAYAIFDLLNVASIHNRTFPSSDLLTDSTLSQLRTLADQHEYSLAYNASEPARAISGATLAGQVVKALNDTITGQSKAKLNIQFGAYASFQSFFGLARLPETNPDFYGIPDYASMMSFELVTNASANPFPSADDISVRFLFHNHTASNDNEPVAYPLFGQPQTVLPWKTFASSMNAFAISDQKDWCRACGNSTGVCATSSGITPPVSSGSPSASGSNSGGISKVVAGVIGALVTLAVVLGAQILIMLLAGLRVVSKKRLATAPSPTGSAVKA